MYFTILQNQMMTGFVKVIEKMCENNFENANSVWESLGRF